MWDQSGKNIRRYDPERSLQVLKYLETYGLLTGPIRRYLLKPLVLIDNCSFLDQTLPITKIFKRLNLW